MQKIQGERARRAAVTAQQKAAAAQRKKPKPSDGLEIDWETVGNPLVNAGDDAGEVLVSLIGQADADAGAASAAPPAERGAGGGDGGAGGSQPLRDDAGVEPPR